MGEMRSVFGAASKWRAEVVPHPLNQEATGDENEATERGRHEESRWQSQRLDWATLLRRVYNIDALRCECGGDIRFEELVEEPKKAQAFLELHEIESPRGSSSREHVEPWTDAPNIALVLGLWSVQEAEAPKQSSLQGSTVEAEPTHSAPWEHRDFWDVIPQRTPTSWTKSPQTSPQAPSAELFSSTEPEKPHRTFTHVLFSISDLGPLFKRA